MTKEDTIMGNNGKTYRQVPYPETWNERSETYRSGWVDGVETAYVSWAGPERPIGAETAGDTAAAGAPELSALQLVMEDNMRDAKQVVRDMSPRDRAVLSFLLTELSWLIDDTESARRLSG